jgi:hypothetical protein
MESDWILWIAVLVLWPAAGIALAYVFGEIAGGAEVSEDTTLRTEVSYLRRQTRANSPRYGSTGTRIRRAAGDRGRR